MIYSNNWKRIWYLEVVSAVTNLKFVALVLEPTDRQKLRGPQGALTAGFKKSDNIMNSVITVREILGRVLKMSPRFKYPKIK